MVNKHLLSLLAFMLLANMSFAQMNVQGTITEAESGEPLPGVSVVLKGTTQGTVTDVDGNYTIEVPSSQSILVFSSVGYVSEEIVVNNRSTIDVSMIADITTLGEVVVMGYNTVRRSDLAGAVSVVDPKEFGDIAVSNTQQLLQGKVAGVQVLNQSGLPGDPSRIIVRGTGTFTDTDPLYVIDGIQANANAFNSISPADIKEVTVLKDASSTAIYGAQGANGVVIVTTKKGETGKPQIRYDGYVGFAEPWNKFDMMNANQYIDLVEDIAATQNTELTPKLLTDEVRRDVTDWQDEMYQSNAPITEHRLSVSGGNEKVTYMVSGAYLNQEATIKSRTFERYNLRFSLQENVGKRFKFGQNVNIRFQNKTGQTADLIGGLRMPPYSPVLDPSNLGGYAKVTTIEDLNDAFNPMTEVNLRSIEDRNYYALIQLFGEVEIIDGLKFKSQFQTSYDFSQRYDYEEENANGNLVNPSFLQEYYGYSIGAPMFENFLTYNKTFANKHSINVMVGNTIRKGGNFRNITINGSDFPNDDIKQIGVATEVSLFGASAGFGTSNLLSYFAQLGYVYDDRFVFTFNFRRDGSPAFGEENRFGNFPSLGASWNIHEEQFMANQGIFSTLKLRASWGKVGNANIGLFRTDPTVWSGESQNIVYSLGPDKTYINGATINSLPNPELKWEETTQIDVGLDFGFLNDRLNLTLDYYKRDNEDLLTNIPIPLSTGVGGPNDVTGTIPTNAGTAYNEGIEVVLNYNGSVGDFTYSIGANTSYNKNEVTFLGTDDAQPIVGGGIDGGINLTRTDVGQPLGAFYGYRIDRVVSTTAEADDLQEFQPGILAGDYLYKDLNGDGVINEDDQETLGSPIPVWQYGLNLNMAYKGFDLMLSLQGVADVEIANALNYWMTGTTRPFNAKAELVNRWRQEGDVAKYPRAGQNQTGSGNLRPSDFYIEDGSYMRLRNLTLGYSLPVSLLEGTNAISRVRFYVTAQNLFTITNYSGYDPEVSAEGEMDEDYLFSRGIDRDQYPIPRMYMFGVQVDF